MLRKVFKTNAKSEIPLQSMIYDLLIHTGVSFAHYYGAKLKKRPIRAHWDRACLVSNYFSFRKVGKTNLMWLLVSAACVITYQRAFPKSLSVFVLL